MANPNFVPSFSTNEVFRNLDNTRCLTDDLDAMDTSIATLQTGKADSVHTHDGYATADHTHTGYAESTHSHSEYASATHDHTGYAEANHTHPEYASATHEHTGYAAEDHTHTGFAPSTHTHTASEVGAAEANHTHSGYASSTHDHDSDYAPVSHSHSGYALSSHTHTGFASSSHNHDSDYVSSSGGTIGGDVNVTGVIRANGQQAFYYNGTTNSQTIGTNNATGGTTIGCNADANTTINGANVKTKNTIPQASNTYTLGSTSFRWKNIYANNAVNVSSDERMKRDIASMNEASLAEFVGKLNVVSYNYNDDSADAKSRIGLVAQEVQAADAELAKFFVEEDEEGMLGMTPANLVFALIATVQDLQHQIAELKAAQ